MLLGVCEMHSERTGRIFSKLGRGTGLGGEAGIGETLTLDPRDLYSWSFVTNEYIPLLSMKLKVFKS